MDMCRNTTVALEEPGSSFQGQREDCYKSTTEYHTNAYQITDEELPPMHGDAIRIALYFLDELVFSEESHNLQSLCVDIAQSALQHYYRAMLLKLAKEFRHHLYAKRQPRWHNRKLTGHLFHTMCVVAGHQVIKQVYSKRRTGRGNPDTKR
jgi:hypothetical protein